MVPAKANLCRKEGMRTRHVVRMDHLPRGTRPHSESWAAAGRKRQRPLMALTWCFDPRRWETARGPAAAFSAPSAANLRKRIWQIYMKFCMIFFLIYFAAWAIMN